MIRSMYAAVSGLRSHQTMMDVVGNNIANVNTHGFKKSDTIFEDVLSQTLNGAGAPTATLGGTNPAQIGLGSTVGAIAQSFASGALDFFFEHRVDGDLSIALFDPVRLELGVDYLRADQPQILARGRAFGFLPEAFRWTVGAELGLRFGLTRAHEIELRYRHLFREIWYEDPFFPIAVPNRGLTLTWTARAR